MSGVLERAEAAADARAQTLRTAVRAKLARALPGVAIREEEDRLLLTGRDLLHRWLARAELRDWRGTGS